MKQLEMMMNTKIEGSVAAVYRKTGVPSYEGNPLIECLPSLGSVADVIKRLDRFPSKVLRSASPTIRASELTTALSNIFIGLPQHYDLAVFIDTKIKQGYFPRNPNLRQNPKLLQSNYEKMLRGEVLTNIPKVNQFTSPASGFIVGIAGNGKTSGFEHSLSFYPQVIEHEAHDLVQITYLYINFPHDGRLQTLCKNFFDALNLAINKPNHNWLEEREYLDPMLGKMQAAVIHFNIGILVIDEFQTWRKQAKSSSDVIGFLVSLINTIKLPIIFSGTPEAKGKLESKLASARRVSGFDVWDPLKAYCLEAHEVKKDQLWDYFVDKLWHFQYLSKPPKKLSKEVNDAWFDCSQGIIDIAIKLYIQVQLRAIHSQKEVITAELIRRVYEDDFKSVHTIIDALRSGDPDQVSMFPDLPQSEIVNNIASLQDSIRKRNIKSVIDNLPPIAQEVLDILISLGYEIKVALPVVESIFAENTNLDKRGLLTLAMDLLAIKNETKPTKKNKPSSKKEKPEPPIFSSGGPGSLFDKTVGSE